MFLCGSFFHVQLSSLPQLKPQSRYVFLIFESVEAFIQTKGIKKYFQFSALFIIPNKVLSVYLSVVRCTNSKGPK